MLKIINFARSEHRFQYWRVLPIIVIFLMFAVCPAYAVGTAQSTDILVQCNSSGVITNNTAISGVNLPTITYDTSGNFYVNSVDVAIYTGSTLVKELDGYTTTNLQVALGAVTNYDYNATTPVVYEIKYRGHYGVAGAGAQDITEEWRSSGLYFRVVQNTSTTTHTVSVSANPSAGGSVSGGGTNNEGASVTVTASANSGYGFVNWTEGGSSVSTNASYTFTLGTTSRTLVANFTAKQTYTVAYNGNGNSGGSVPTDSNNYTTGSAITVLGNTGSLVKTGNTFVGWNSAADGSGTSYAAGATLTMGTANVILYAQWTTKPTYTVAYNGNGSSGGSVPIDSNNYTTSAAITVLGNTGSLVKTGNTFAGWNIAANGSGTSYAAGATLSMGSANVILYAQWTANQTNRGGDRGGYTPAPTPTTVTGSIIDGTTGAKISNITATVTTDSHGNATISMKAAQTVMLKQPDGSTSPLGDVSKVVITTAAGAPVTISADGTIQVTNLAKGTDNHFNITYDLGNGQTITLGTMEIKIGSNGEVTITTTLIDPYGIIIDAATGKILEGVNVILYYANTDRNKAAGKTPDTVVPLPGIDGFKPNNNKNPQLSDASGAYGFMVFPTTDYYLVATKDGYKPYTSPTISVEQDIVKWDFKMNQVTTSGVERLAGLSRVDTALAIAKANYQGQVQSVILATADNYPDALAGSVLAYKLNAPILLVGNSDADQAKVLEYMKANLDPAGRVYILGGTAVVSSAMEGKVTASGFQKITRLGGVDRYDTSVKIADQLQVQIGTPIVLAYGENYPDALSISSIAAQMQSPILLVQKDGLSDAVQKEIAAIKPTKVYIIGGLGVISTAVENQVTQLTGLAQSNIVRIGGVDRYETSLAVAKYFNLAGQSVCIATGNNFPDALAGSVYAANHNAPIILADGSLSDQVMDYLQTRKLTGATLFGGEAVVSKDIEQQLGQLIGK